jgi:uncharacterized coiled-coil protein SlyX
MKMSTLSEIEQLQNEKTRLEEESHSLDEKLKQLDIRWKILNEKVAIQELNNANAAKKETISQLEAKIGSLETRLEKLLTARVFKKEYTPTSENAESHETVNETSNASDGEHEKDEDTIRVMAFNNDEEISDNFSAEQKESQGPFY